MDNLINPNDLGTFLVAEYTQRIDINDLVSQAQKQLKIRLVEAQIEAIGTSVSFTTSKTRFQGERLWFVCPCCKQKKGTLYKNQLTEVLACRSCLGIKYKKQRFKGMIEN